MRGFSPILFVTTVLVSAFLLFQVQPMLARYILPWFGGTPAVWTVCMLFFQLFLFLGYAYAHALQRWFHISAQAGIHVSLLVVAVITLPIEPDPSWQQAGSDAPIFTILTLLVTTVGIPYFLLSSTGPLLQVWFSRAHEDRSPYPLYAVSNLGSFVALLSYPFLFEPLLPVSQQVDIWSLAFAGFALLFIAISFFIVTRVGTSSAAHEAVASDGPSRVSSLDRVLWIVLPACATLILLAITNHITQDIAAIPLLWIVPLSLYLLSFILCFESDRWYRPRPWALAMILAILLLTLTSLIWKTSAIAGIGIFNAILFIACMMCHGELAALRPGPDKLTSFYLSLAGGGALGGLMVGLVAPMIFSSYIEVQLSLIAIVLLILLVNRHDQGSVFNKGSSTRRAATGLGTMVFATIIVFAISSDTRRFTSTTRNFYGVLKELEKTDEVGRQMRQLIHGRIVHGMQYLDKELLDTPTSYYGRTTGIGQVMTAPLTNGKTDSLDTPRNIGVVGLGAGTLSAYGNSGDKIRFYEINPEITRIARSSFQFLSRTPADVSIVHGDALITLKREVDNKFDILVLDAFSGDAIPVHLLTEEAFATYVQHLGQDGVISIHISNQYFDLRPVVWALADRFGLESAEILSPANADDGTLAAQWIILSNNENVMKALQSYIHFTSRDYSRGTTLWTNDFSNVLKLLKFRQ